MKHIKNITLFSCALLVGAALHGNAWDDALANVGGKAAFAGQVGSLNFVKTKALYQQLISAGISEDIAGAFAKAAFNGKGAPAIKNQISGLPGSVDSWAGIQAELGGSSSSSGATPPPPPPATWATNIAGLGAAMGWKFQEDVPAGATLPTDVGGKSTAGITVAQVKATLPKKPAASPPPATGGSATGSSAAEVAALKAQLATAQSQLAAVKEEADKVPGLQSQLAAVKGEADRVPGLQSQLAAALKNAQFVADMKAKLGSNAPAANQALIAKALQQLLEAAQGFSSDAATLEVATKAAEAAAQALTSKDANGSGHVDKSVADRISEALTDLKNNNQVTILTADMGDHEKVALLDATANGVYAQLKDITGAAGGASAYRAATLGRLSGKKASRGRKARNSHRSKAKYNSHRQGRAARRGKA